MSTTTTITRKAVAGETDAGTAAKGEPPGETPVASDQPTRSSKRRVSRKAAVDAPVTVEERHRLIQVAAYRIAEQRGFLGELSVDDWLKAERQVDKLISSGRLGA